MDRREILAEHLDSQAWWRSIKADEYPDDRRNERSSTALSDLAKQVRNLPAAHDGLRLLDEAGGFFDGVVLCGEKAHAFVGQTGFHLSMPGCWDVEDWLTEFTNAVREDAAEPVDEGVGAGE